MGGHLDSRPARSFARSGDAAARRVIRPECRRDFVIDLVGRRSRSAADAGAGLCPVGQRSLAVGRRWPHNALRASSQRSAFSFQLLSGMKSSRRAKNMEG